VPGSCRSFGFLVLAPRHGLSIRIARPVAGVGDRQVAGLQKLAQVEVRTQVIGVDFLTAEEAVCPS